MRPDEYEFLLAGATIVIAFAVLQFFSVWIERERRWRMVIWVGVAAIAGWFTWSIHPDPQSLRFGDFANSFISIAGWLLPP